MEEHQEYLPASIVDKIPAMVRSQLRTLNATQQAEFVEEFNRKSKSVPFAYIFWLLLGWHYAYLGRWGWQFLFWLTAAGIGFWWVVDAFRIPKMVGDDNRDIAVEVMRNMRSIQG